MDFGALSEANPDSTYPLEVLKRGEECRVCRTRGAKDGGS